MLTVHTNRLPPRRRANEPNCQLCMSLLKCKITIVSSLWIANCMTSTLTFNLLIYSYVFLIINYSLLLLLQFRAAIIPFRRSTPPHNEFFQTFLFCKFKKKNIFPRSVQAVYLFWNFFLLLLLYLLPQSVEQPVRKKPKS